MRKWNHEPPHANTHINDDVSIEEDKENNMINEDTLVESAKTEPALNDDPNSLENSRYAQNEVENLHHEIELAQTVESEENGKGKGKGKAKFEPQPADFSKDHQIYIPIGLNEVTSDQFLSGSEVTRSLFSQILNLIQSNQLLYPLERRQKMDNGKTVIDNVLFYDSDTERLSESDLLEFFEFPDEFVKDLSDKHKIVTDNLPDLKPTFYNGNGYVIVGGGKYSWFALLVIEILRELGSEFPVEVVLPSRSEYEEQFCQVTLKKLNAKCIVLDDVFGDTLKDFELTGYQFKSFALLASSFENAFLLDSDTYPVSNPDLLFKSDLYLEKTMITWPDYWRRTTSPIFYKIRDTKIGNRVRHLNDLWTDKKHFLIPGELEHDDIRKEEVPFHDRDGTLIDFTTESGEMLINKKIHFKALLLALYYNFDGQFGYYPLLSQGGAGEGDKETFVAASNFYGLNYYQVYKKPDRAYGYYRDGEFVDTSIIQYDPLTDYKILSEIKDKIKENSKVDSFTYDYSNVFTDNFQIWNSKPLFYHVHETKLEPFHLIRYNHLLNADGKQIRNMGGDWPRFDFDLEWYLWRVIDRYMCEKKSDFKYFEDEDREVLCGEFMRERLNYLKKSHYFFLKHWVDNQPIDNLRRAELD
ncbi:hypothetical protein DAMA08_014610 [Martiniozyma asiatica (nom. inval.)]|nr:hypothetical protein DAMA08_014610 [Martiniozyma asiatica]